MDTNWCLRCEKQTLDDDDLYCSSHCRLLDLAPSLSIPSSLSSPPSLSPSTSISETTSPSSSLEVKTPEGMDWGDGGYAGVVVLSGVKRRKRLVSMDVVNPFAATRETPDVALEEARKVGGSVDLGKELRRRSGDVWFGWDDDDVHVGRTAA